MEMNRTYFAEKNTDNPQICTSLDARWKKKERKTENNMEKNSWERDDCHAALSGFVEEASSGLAVVERLCGHSKPKAHGCL